MFPVRWRTMSLLYSVAATTLAGGTAVAVCTRGGGDAAAAPEMPEDCELPSCASKQDMLNAMLDPGRKNRTPPARRREPLPSDHGVPEPYRACPADKDELGRHSWTLLHTIAATFPDKPTEEHKRAALDLVHSMSLLYPCWYCRAHLQSHMEEEPPTVESREAFSLWLCKHHNAVNEHNGKQTFPCSLPALDERWRVGATGCWNHAAKKPGSWASDTHPEEDDEDEE